MAGPLQGVPSSGAPLAGMTGLNGPVDNDPHGTTKRDPSNWGGPVDPRHAIPGDSSHEPRYAGTPYAPDSLVLGTTPPLASMPGHVRDQTPRSHAAPWPRGIETDDVVAGEQSQILHGVDLGGSTYLNDGPVPYPVEVESVYNLSPNASDLSNQVPGQLRGLSTDVDQGYGQDNSGTFGYGHQQRREFHTDMPFDYTALYAGDRPFYGKHPVWTNRLDGDDSPYGLAGDNSVGMNLAPGPVGYSTPYEQPSNPTVAPVTGYAQAAPVDDFGWMAG
jgi:hypothetical protein